MPTVFISTGERSGELYAGLITRELQSSNPRVRIVRGIGNSSAPVGFGAGASKASSTIEKVKIIERQVQDIKPDIFLASAWSEPNIVLGYRLRKLSKMKRVFFAPPQLWAWGRFRKILLRKGYDLLLTLYPEDSTFLSSLGLSARFGGNPLVGHLSPYFTRKTPKSKRIALLPGSRLSEKSSNIHFLLSFRDKWLASNPSSRFAWLFLTSSEAEESAQLLPPEDVVVGGDARFAALASSSLAMVTSGTASLETALLGVPQVVFYTLPKTEAFLIRLFTRVRYFALPNIISGKMVVPEILNPHPDELDRLAKDVLTNPYQSQNLTSRLRSHLAPPVDNPDLLSKLILE